MTILGVYVCDHRRAIVWCDTEVFIQGRPAGQCVKMTINPVACLIAVGNGRSSILAPARGLVGNATDLDAVIGELPQNLLRESKEISAEYPSATANFAVVGWSKCYRRIVAYMFNGGMDFQPERVDTISWPPAADLPSTHPVRLADITGIAQMQMYTLQRSLPEATGGTLIGAVVTPNGITASPLLNLATGMGIRASVT